MALLAALALAPPADGFSSVFRRPFFPRTVAAPPSAPPLAPLRAAAFDSAVGYTAPTIEEEDFTAAAWRSALTSALGGIGADVLSRDDLDFALVTVAQELVEEEFDYDDDDDDDDDGDGSGQNSSFAEFVAETQRLLGKQVRHVAVTVGAGVIGGGEEVEGRGAAPGARAHSLLKSPIRMLLIRAPIAGHSSSGELKRESHGDHKILILKEA